jgi:hypothetical protein
MLSGSASFGAVMQSTDLTHSLFWNSVVRILDFIAHGPQVSRPQP